MGTIPISGTKSEQGIHHMQVTITLASVATGTVAKGPSKGQKFSTSKGATAHFANGDKPVTGCRRCPTMCAYTAG